MQNDPRKLQQTINWTLYGACEQYGQNKLRLRFTTVELSLSEFALIGKADKADRGLYRFMCSVDVLCSLFV